MFTSIIIIYYIRQYNEVILPIQKALLNQGIVEMV